MVSKSYELSNEAIVRNTTRTSKKLYNALFAPQGFIWVLAVLLVLQVLLPVLWPLWTIIIAVLAIMHSDYKFSMPLRMPFDVGGLDKSDYDSVTSTGSLLGVKTSNVIKKSRKAAGILHLGNVNSPNEADHKQELWITNNDAKTHMMLLGTTGSGKTETLIGLSYNALSWGSAFCYADGKGDSSLVFSLWSIARKMGREDDFLVLNYLTGVRSEFADGGSKAPTNTMNPFAVGSADVLLQFTTSLLPEAGGDSAVWQANAIEMMSAVLVLLCYKRDIGEINLSLTTLRDNLGLEKLAKFYIEGKEGGIPDEYFSPLRNYLESSLPGFKPALAHKPSEWDDVVYSQHGFLTRQFGQVFSMMSDTYGSIFNCEFPEIDMNDVLLNNRILVVLIPTLEKSSQEAAALGKLFISAIKLMMARNLGYDFEGTTDDVLGSKSTASSYPHLIICDELSYYFETGLKAMFAQARSLGFMMVAAMQDLQGFKGLNYADAESMFANTSIKWCLKLEDPNDTYEFVRDAAGTSNYSMVSGHDAKGGISGINYKHQDHVSVQRRERVTLDTLKALRPGEGVLIFENKVINTKSFIVPDEDKTSKTLPARLNRFVEVAAPSLDNLPMDAQRHNRVNPVAARFIKQCFENNMQPPFADIDNPILDRVIAMSETVSKDKSLQFEHDQVGAIMFESARQRLHELKGDGIGKPWQSPDYDD